MLFVVLAWNGKRRKGPLGGHRSATFVLVFVFGLLQKNLTSWGSFLKLHHVHAYPGVEGEEGSLAEGICSESFSGSEEEGEKLDNRPFASNRNLGWTVTYSEWVCSVVQCS